MQTWHFVNGLWYNYLEEEEEEEQQQQQLRFLKEVGVNRVYVHKTSLATP